MNPLPHIPDFRTGANAPRREMGASMIEILISVLLISIGLLGVAGLSSSTISYNKTSQLRLTGMALANDLADRARNNVYGFDLKKYDISAEQAVPGTPVAGNTNFDADVSVAATATTVAEGLAAEDVDQFLRSVALRLPGGTAVVESYPRPNSRDMDVWLLWKEPTTDADDSADPNTGVKTSDKGAFSLFDAGKTNCPTNLSDTQKKLYSCMYFKVGL